MRDNENLLEFIYEQYKFYIVRWGQYVPINHAKKLAILNFLIEASLEDRKMEFSVKDLKWMFAN